MRKYLFHLLLSLALIIQGMGAACAKGPMMAGMGAAANANASATLAMAGDTDSTDCPGCPSCPDKHKHGNDCTPGCAMTAGVPPLRAVTPQSLPATTVLLALEPSLVDFLQAPPTPPPIA